MPEGDSIFLFAGAAIAISGAGLTVLGARFRAIPDKRRAATVIFFSGLVDIALGIALICWHTLT